MSMCQYVVADGTMKCLRRDRQQDNELAFDQLSRTLRYSGTFDEIEDPEAVGRYKQLESDFIAGFANHADKGLTLTLTLTLTLMLTLMGQRSC